MFTECYIDNTTLVARVCRLEHCATFVYKFSVTVGFDKVSDYQIRPMNISWSFFPVCMSLVISIRTVRYLIKVCKKHQAHILKYIFHVNKQYTVCNTIARLFTFGSIVACVVGIDYTVDNRLSYLMRTHVSILSTLRMQSVGVTYILLPVSIVCCICI